MSTVEVCTNKEGVCAYQECTCGIHSVLTRSMCLPRVCTWYPQCANKECVLTKSVHMVSTVC